MREIFFKTKNRTIQAFQSSNNFGDQVIEVIDLNGKSNKEFICGEILMINIEMENNWVEFSEENIKSMLKDMLIKL